MNPDTLTLLRRIAIGPATREELLTATGFAEINARLGTLQTHKLIAGEHSPGQKSIYSATQKGRRLLASLEKPTGNVAGPRIPYSRESYRPPAWIAPREMARSRA
jgi:hypothetical protein